MTFEFAYGIIGGCSFVLLMLFGAPAFIKAVCEQSEGKERQQRALLASTLFVLLSFSVLFVWPLAAIALATYYFNKDK